MHSRILQFLSKMPEEVFYAALSYGCIYGAKGLLAPLSPHLQDKWKQVAVNLSHEGEFIEYVHRRYVNMSGVRDFGQGYLYVITLALRNLTYAMALACFGVLLTPLSALIRGILLAGVLFWLRKALRWLIPRDSWIRDQPRENWERIAYLEERLMGKCQDATTKWLDEFSVGD